MVELLTQLVRLNLAAAAAILLVLALRATARKAFGARVAYGLWSLPLLAAAALMVPARVVTAPPLQPLALQSAPAVLAGSTTALPAPPSAALDLSQLLFAVWTAGALAALALTAWNQRRFLTEAAKGALGPAVVGVFAPRIIKPNDFADRFTADEQRLVLEHETAHLARQDSRINALVVLIQCLNWFNPVIHLGARFLRIDQELACDEAVVTRFPSARPAYAKALLKAQLAIRPLPLGCYWPSGTEHPLLERIAMIDRASQSRARRLAGACALAALAAATGLAAWAAQPPQIAPAPPTAPTRGAPASTPRPAAPIVQPPRESAAPQTDLCLSNACSEGASILKGKKISDAIKAGRPGDAYASGGTAADVMAAQLSAAAQDPNAPPGFLTNVVQGTEKFVKTPDGQVAVYADQTTRNGAPLGFIVLRNGLDGQMAPADAPLGQDVVAQIQKDRGITPRRPPPEQ